MAYIRKISPKDLHGEPEGKVKLKLGILGTTADVVDVAVKHKHYLIEHGMGYGEDGRLSHTTMMHHMMKPRRHEVPE